jgi:benzoate-CoA ligase
MKPNKAPAAGTKTAYDFDYFNAADDLLLHNLAAGRGSRIAVIDRSGEHSYDDLNLRVNRFANLLTSLGIGIEQRILLCLYDTIDFHTCFLGAIRAGAIPVPVNTQLTAHDYAYMLQDTRAKLLVYSEEISESFESQTGDHPFLIRSLISGPAANAENRGLETALDGMPDVFETAPTRRDDVAVWMYTSGTTGRPKGVVHSQTDIRAIADHFGTEILAVSDSDLVFSAPKLFFGYGLGNGLVFPLAAGATTVLLDGQPTPESVAGILNQYHPTLFFSVPTLYSMMLNTGNLPNNPDKLPRVCFSAGEALPEAVLNQWRELVGGDILDGIGSTEMFHMYMSNRTGDVRPGSSGKPLKGYEVRLLDDDGQPVGPGEVAELHVSGPSCASGYWNRQRETTAAFLGRWFKSGDKYYQDEDGYFVYCGRSDDLLKVGGIWVSPMQVENALLGHAAVFEAAVIGAEDKNHMIKPKAFIVLADDVKPEPGLENELIDFVCSQISDFKRPRWIEFVPELPKTATGKIQRFKLR